MANTFGAVEFHQEQQDGRSVVVWPSETVLVVEHIPGGDIDIVHHLGRRGTQEVTIAVVVPAANWASFVAMRGQTATLTLIDNAGRSATLTKIANARSFPEGFYKAQATWLG